VAWAHYACGELDEALVLERDVVEHTRHEKEQEMHRFRLALLERAIAGREAGAAK
jgi:hypothetical protein